MNKASIALRIQHVGLWIRDLARSSQFYQRVLGFEKRYGYYVPAHFVQQIFDQDTGCRVEVYLQDEVVLELFQPDQKMDNQGSAPLAPAVNHFGLEALDKRAFCQKAKEKGAQVIEVAREDHLVYLIRDPDGILIEIKER